MSDTKKLYRSQTDKVFAGVCGGIAEYFGKDAVLIRFLWIVMTMLGGSGIILYIVALFIVPERPLAESSTPQTASVDFSAAKIFGTLFIVLGILILLDNLDVLSFHNMRHLFWDYGMPSFLILLGIFFIIVRSKKTEAPSLFSQENSTEGTSPPVTADAPNRTSPKKKELRRSSKDKKFLGICGGFAEYFDIDPSIVRIAYAIFTVFSSGAGIIIYFVMYLVIPESADMKGRS
jgi:phage shock protein C